MSKQYIRVCFCILDAIICLIWVGHLTVIGWRGTWNLLDVYILPEKPILSATITAVLGCFVCAVTKSLMPLFNRYVTKKNKVLYIIISRLVSYILAVSTMTQWRGVWYLLDISMDRGWKSNTACLVISLAVIKMLQISVLIVYNPPIVIGYDEQDNFFYSEGRAKIQASKPFLYIVDICEYQIILLSLVISAWRGLWNIYNDVILPDNFLYSNVITYVAGSLICLLLILIQKPVALLSKRCDQYHWTIAGVVAFWRGWWNITEGILLPDLVMGGWICHTVGIVGLTITGMMCSLYDMSCQTDGDFLQGSTFWPTQFLQIIFDDKINPQTDSKCSKENEEEELNL